MLAALTLSTLGSNLQQSSHQIASAKKVLFDFFLLIMLAKPISINIGLLISFARGIDPLLVNV